MTNEQAARLLLLIGNYAESYKDQYPDLSVRELVDDLIATLPEGDVGVTHTGILFLEEEINMAIGQCRKWR